MIMTQMTRDEAVALYDGHHFSFRSAEWGNQTVALVNGQLGTVPASGYYAGLIYGYVR